MDESARYTCPSCGESVDVPIDGSAGPDQEYVEDCPVCCRPNLLRIRIDRGGGVELEASAE